MDGARSVVRMLRGSPPGGGYEERRAESVPRCDDVTSPQPRKVGDNFWGSRRHAGAREERCKVLIRSAVG